jgi:hypothetical protein
MTETDKQVIPFSEVSIFSLYSKRRKISSEMKCLTCIHSTNFRKKIRVILGISSVNHINKEFLVSWTQVMASLASYVLPKSKWILIKNVYRDTYTFTRIKILGAHKKQVWRTNAVKVCFIMLDAGNSITHCKR